MCTCRLRAHRFVCVCVFCHPGAHRLPPLPLCLVSLGLDLIRCTIASTSTAQFGFVNSTAAAPQGVWIGAGNGLFFAPSGGSGAAVQVLADDIWSVAYGSTDDIVAAGNSQKLFFFHASASAAAIYSGAGVSSAPPAPFRWEWVTIVPSGTGGVVDNMIAGMAFDSQGRLYVANPTCLNVRARNGSFSRVSGLQGLPYV